MSKVEYRHLNRICSALVREGFDVDPPKGTEYLDVWGFERVPGRSRRRRCFEEIYCTVIQVGGLCVSYWSTTKTNDEGPSVEIEDTPSGLRGVEQLIAALSVQRIREAACVKE